MNAEIIVGKNPVTFRALLEAGKIMIEGATSQTPHSKTHLDRGVEMEANRCVVGVWEDAAKKTKFPVNDNSSY